METLQIIWYALTGVLLAAFLIMGGVDFGVGILSVFLKRGHYKSFAARSILPFWDGNQVWLITAGGALFAAFPPAYSAILSTMYTPVMLLLFFITLRIAGIEFFATAKSEKSENLGQLVFGFSSFIVILLMGVALGAIFEGDVLPCKQDFFENFSRIFTPISLCAAILLLCFCAAQGAYFLALNAEEKDSEFFVLLARKSLKALIMAYTLYVLALVLNYKMSFVLPLCFIVCYLVLRVAYMALKRGKLVFAMILNSLFAMLAVATHLILAFPHIVPSKISSEGISIWNGSSGELTLTVMLIVAFVGVPLAIAYNIYCYSVFLQGEKNKNLTY